MTSKICIVLLMCCGAMFASNRQVCGATVSLASQMNGAGGFTENVLTGAQARIHFGSGGTGDADGFYSLVNPGIRYGSGVDLFPNESNFSIGSFDFDSSFVTGEGLEVVPLTNLNMSGFWAPGSATTDVSDAGLQHWFFELPRSFAFAPFDASATATFSDGLLTSLNATTAAQFRLLDGRANTVVWNGTLNLAGNTIQIHFNDTQPFHADHLGVLESTFTSDLTGTVNAVGSYQVTAVPEPSGFALLALAGAGLVWSWRRYGHLDALPL